MHKINIVADENILLLEEFFAPIATITKVDGRHITRADVKQADALVLRSTAQVNKPLLAGSCVQFVGTCTIGIDHLQTDYLTSQGIHWANAPGCNASGVVDYVISAINHAWQVHGVDPTQKTIGIVGVGNVGGQLFKRLQQAGLKVICYDPVLKKQQQKQQQKQQAAQLSAFNPVYGTELLPSLTELINTADIICLHTPLTHTGDYPTYGMINQRIIESLLPGTLFISAGRGEVVDQNALLARLQQHNDLLVYLDVWQQEPHIDTALLPYCQIATPHIAGHSLEGKVRGTAIIYQALCAHFNLPANQTLVDLLPQSSVERLQVNEHISLSALLNVACHSVYVIEQDDQRCRTALLHQPDNVAGQFDYLRKTYPIRREFSTLVVDGLNDPVKQQFLAGLGFNVAGFNITDMRQSS